MKRTTSILCGFVLGVGVLVGLAAVSVAPSGGGTLTGSTITVSNVVAYGYAETAVVHTDAGPWTFDLSATNRVYTCINTGAVAVTFSNFTVGNQAKIVLGNSQATNCANTFTAPALTTLVWEGLVLTNIAPAKWQTLYFDCKVVTGTNYIFATGAEQQ